MAGGERLFHEMDDDGVCIHCGFDGAEHWHLTKRVMEASEYKAKQESGEYDYATYCEKRKE